MHSPPSSDYRSGSSLAAHRRASTGREVFIAPWPSGEELQVPSCHPYEVRARGSERSRRVRFGTGPGSLEKVAVLRSRFLKTQASLHGRRCFGLAAWRRSSGRRSSCSVEGLLKKNPKQEPMGGIRRPLTIKCTRNNEFGRQGHAFAGNFSWDHEKCFLFRGCPDSFYIYMSSPVLP